MLAKAGVAGFLLRSWDIVLPSDILGSGLSALKSILFYKIGYNENY